MPKTLFLIAYALLSTYLVSRPFWLLQGTMRILIAFSTFSSIFYLLNLNIDNSILQIQGYSISTLFIPFLFLAGPYTMFNSSNKRVTQRTFRNHLVPFSLAILIVVLRELYSEFELDSFINSTDNNLLSEVTNYIANNHLLLLLFLYPGHNSIYAILCIEHRYANGVHWTLLIWPISLLVTSLFTFDFLYTIVSGNYLFIRDPMFQKLLICIPGMAIVYEILFLNTPSVRLIRSKTSLNKKSPLNIEFIQNYIDSLAYDNKCVLFNSYTTKADFIENAPFTPEQWREYTKVTSKGFITISKEIRIKKAVELINGHYLNQHSIDALSRNVGYESRTSLYSAFKEIVGVTLSEYLEDAE